MARLGGRLLEITFPVVGNHEYATPGATGYFEYFGSRAADPGRGWYGFDLGRWHLVALNSNCEQVRCGARSPQARWLRRDLRLNPRRCVLAFFHHPRFASGPHGPDRRLEPLWRVLYRRDAELVLSGHDHLYERFEPQTARGRIDRRRGIVQFVAGTGGKSLYYFRNRQPNAAARHRAFGLLRLALARGRYRWAFLSAPRGNVLDRGARSCH
jgi:3',5'-cyclic AMP phosphodiesterase CpdA